MKRKGRGHSKEEVSGGRAAVKRKGRGHSKEEVSGGRTEGRGKGEATARKRCQVDGDIRSPHPFCSLFPDAVIQHAVRRKSTPLKTIYPSFHRHLRTNHALTDNLCQAETQVTKSPAGSQIWTEHKQQQTQPRQTVSQYIFTFHL